MLNLWFQVVFKDSMSSSVAGVTEGDYRSKKSPEQTTEGDHWSIFINDKNIKVRMSAYNIL